MIAESTHGKVITFYSYKGGTGRTMALANVAWLMGSQPDKPGKILMIDWDLEAPGLDRYFRSLVNNQFPNQSSRENEFDQHPGLIDLFAELNAKTIGEEWGSSNDLEAAAVELVDAVQLDKYVIEVKVDSLYLMKAGRFDDQYDTRVNTFDWEGLYRRSPWLIQAIAERLADQYSYVLIDSRTGITDISGICTMLMPDVLVAVFTPNRQSLFGVLRQIRTAADYRLRSGDLRSLNVFPLLSRVELSEPTLRENWRYGQPEEEIPGFQSQFEELFKEIYGLAECSLESYFDDVQIQHVPRFSYGEDIAALLERVDDRLSLTRSYQSFTQRITQTSNPWEEYIPKGEGEADPISYWLGRPASIADDFVGRETELEGIGKAFEDHRAVVISGGAGSGKSRLAAEYVHRSGTKGFWTTASNDVLSTLSALASALDIEIGNRTDSEVAADVRKFLAGMPTDTLWIIDNLERLEQVTQIMNAVNIRLLITTRDGRSQVLPPTTVAFQQLQVFDRRPAIALLNSRSKSDPDDPALSEIADLVGDLPLALEMLAIRLGEFGQTPEKVLDQLHRVPTPIGLMRFQQSGGTTISSVEGIYNTITGTLDSLSEYARKQISPLGYISDAPIPSNFLSEIIGIDDEELDSLIEEARLYSVISIINGVAEVSALTIAAIAATNSEGALETTLHRGLQRIASINHDRPAELREEITHHQRIFSESQKALEPENADLVAFAVELAIGYGARGRFEDAIALNKETLQIRERVLGPEHPDTLESRNNLAQGFRDLGQYEEAFKFDKETLRIRERVLGPEHPDTLESRNNLALSYRALGSYEEAVRLDEETLQIRERVLGSEHPDTLRSRSNLASDYGALGRNEEAVVLVADTLHIMERVLGSEHPDTLQSRSNLAIGYSYLERFEDAAVLAEETLHIMERVLGSEHPDTLRSRSILASGYDALGRNDEAAALNEQTLRVRERVLRPEHPDTLESRNNLALSYRALGRYEEAVRLDEETLSIRERVLGPEHPDTLESRNNLAVGYRALGRDAEADGLESGE